METNREIEESRVAWEWGLEYCKRTEKYEPREEYFVLLEKLIDILEERLKGNRPVFMQRNDPYFSNKFRELWMKVDFTS